MAVTALTVHHACGDDDIQPFFKNFTQALSRAELVAVILPSSNDHEETLAACYGSDNVFILSQTLKAEIKVIPNWRSETRIEIVWGASRATLPLDSLYDALVISNKEPHSLTLTDALSYLRAQMPKGLKELYTAPDWQSHLPPPKLTGTAPKTDKRLLKQLLIQSEWLKERSLEDGKESWLKKKDFYR